MLLRIFREIDDGSGDVDIKEFVSLWRKLGVEVRLCCFLMKVPPLLRRLYEDP